MTYVRVIGGINSPSVRLYDTVTHQDIGDPGTQGTSVFANREYVLGVRLFSDLSLPNTVPVTVRFWQIPGGIGLQAISLGSINVNSPSPGGSSDYFNSTGAKFKIATAGEHDCAAVSITDQLDIYTDIDANHLDRLHALATDGGQGWRNCNSITTGRSRQINLNLAAYGTSMDAPTKLQVSALKVPKKWWTSSAKLAALHEVLSAAGNTYPPFLLPKLQNTLESADLRFSVRPRKACVEVSQLKAGNWLVKQIRQGDPKIEISTSLPKNARSGDIYVITTTAVYPKANNKRAAYNLVVYVE